MHLNGTCDSCAAATTTAAPLVAESCQVVGFQAEAAMQWGEKALVGLKGNP